MSDSTVPAIPAKKSILSNEQYNVLKWFAMVFLPAAAALYLGLAALWELPKPNEVAGTITLLNTFLGVLLKVSTKTYDQSDERFDGNLLVDDQDNRLIHQLEITTAPEDLGKKDSIVLKVVPTTSE